MAQFNQSLFRIDPTEGLLEYVRAVKPFHSKVLDVLVEYVYSESLSVGMTERHNINIGLPDTQDIVLDPLNPRPQPEPVVYSRGYGYVWSPDDAAGIGGLPQATIIQAQGKITLPASVAGTVITITPDLSGYVFDVDQPVTFQTTGTYPTVSGPAQIHPGAVYYVVSSTPLTITVSEQVGGTPITFTTSGTGTLTVTPINIPVNSFVIQAAPSVNYDIVIASTVTNQLVFGTPFSIVDVDPTMGFWTVSGDLTGVVVPGDVIYVADNGDSSSNQPYTVDSITYNVGPDQTEVYVSQPISIAATGSGTLYVPSIPDDVPYWPAGSAVEIISTGALPFPLQNGETYYLVPTSTIGTFNLSYVRYPTQYDHIVDLGDRGTGTLQVRKTEPFLTREFLRVTGSYLGLNDGLYTTTSLTPLGGNQYRIFVRENVEQTTPVGQPTDGLISYVGTFGDPVAEYVSTPQLYASSHFEETLNFTFEPIPQAAFLQDSFYGTGTLATHSVDSGHTWETFQLTDDLNELILTGGGGLTTTDTDIWARANWTPPDNTLGETFYVQATVYVKEHPGSGSPYFRIFAKEANGMTFYGPHLDVYPNLTTGKIAVELWLGDSVVASFFTADTTVDDDRAITVRMEVEDGVRVKLYVNGTLIHTTVDVTWPKLEYVGFNFRVPSSDPTQFVLDHILATGL